MQLAGEGAGLQGKSPALLWKLKKVSWFFGGEGGGDLIVFIYLWVKLLI